MILIFAAMIGVVAGMIVEYWGHRLEHLKYFRPVDHGLHHVANVSHGWVREFWADFRYAAVPLALIGAGLYVYVSTEAALGTTGGFLLHMTVSAYTHELYHKNENLVFWMQPIHYFHHHNRQWKHNFGITNSICDRLFGTFLDDPTWTRKPVRIRDLFTARWV